MFKQRIDFYPAFDKRHPEPSKNYGIHGVDVAFYLMGPEGTVQFKLSTGWQLPHVALELREKGADICLQTMPIDLGYHSPKPMYDGQPMMTDKCEFAPDGGKCFYDGSSLNADPIFQVLLEKGSEGVWEELSKYYRYTFFERWGLERLSGIREAGGAARAPIQPEGSHDR